MRQLEGPRQNELRSRDKRLPARVPAAALFPLAPFPMAALFPLAALTASSACKDEPSSETRQVQAATAASTCPAAGAVKRDVTLTKKCSPYRQPMGGIDVINGATLTIEAGVEIIFNPNDWLEVGAGGKPGRLIAKGTAEEPIVFTAAGSDTDRGWMGVWFHSGTLEGSVLSHAVVRRAGGLNPLEKPKLPLGCITLTGVKPGSLEIADVRTERCIHGGLRMTESQVRLGSLSFANMPVGFNVDAASAGQILQAALLSDVPQHVIRGGNVTGDARWLPQPVPYVVEGDVRVGGANSPKLTLAAGLELRFAKSRSLVVGEEQPGSLSAEGSAEAPVTLTSAKEPWGGVRFMSQTLEGSRLSYVKVGQTSGEAAVAVRSEPGRVEIRDSTFSENADDVLVGCGAKPKLASNRFGSKSGPSAEKPCK